MLDIAFDGNRELANGRHAKLDLRVVQSPGYYVLRRQVTENRTEYDYPWSGVSYIQ